MIVSTDKDFMQLINKRISILNPITGVIWSKSNFINFKDLGFTPAQYLQFCTMVGDTSDNIKGVDGVGTTTALNLLQQHGSIKEALIFNKKIKTQTNWRIARFVEGENTINRNRKLMRLRSFVKKHFSSLSRIRPKSYDPRFGQFKKAVTEPSLNIGSFVDDFRFWSLPFRKLILKGQKRHP